MPIIYKNKDNKLVTQKDGIVPQLNSTVTINNKQYKVIEINHEINKGGNDQYNVFVQVEKIPNELNKRKEIAESIKKAKEMGLYDQAGHLTSEVIVDDDKDGE